MKLYFSNIFYSFYIITTLSIYVNECTTTNVKAEKGIDDVKLNKSLVIELEDSTFEKKTQASFGSASGIWFVKFYAPWCGHCRSMENDWNELANLLDKQVNVAKIDATKHTITAKRFGITSFPTLLLLKDGNFYQYEKNNRTADSLKQFALNGYKQVNSKPVPKEWSYFARFKFFIKSGFYEAKRIYQLAFPGFITISCISCAVGIFIGMIFSFYWVFLSEKNIKLAKNPSLKRD